MTPSRSTLTAVAAGGLLFLGVAGAAVLSGTGAFAAPSPTPTQSQGAGQGYGNGDQPGRGGPMGEGPGHRGQGKGWAGPGAGGLGRGILHGEVVVNKADGSGTETLLVQQGSVTAKDGSTVTVKSTDGFTVVWTLVTTTTTRGEVTVGAQVHVVGVPDGSGKGTARTLGVRPAGAPAAPGAPGGPGWGHGKRGPGQVPSSPAPSSAPSSAAATSSATA